MKLILISPDKSIEEAEIIAIGDSIDFLKTQASDVIAEKGDDLPLWSTGVIGKPPGELAHGAHTEMQLNKGYILRIVDE